MSNLALTRTDDPAELGWPPTLPIEVALKTASVKEICEAYGLSRDDWEKLRHDPVFIAEVAEANEALKKEGMSFRMKARLQSEELLKTSWKMIHAPSDEVPPAVKADLIKFTIKAAGLSEEKAAASTGQVGTALQININLG
jgi:hypothetical protein